MIRVLTMIVLLLATSLVSAAVPQCSDADVIEQARKLLVFHFGDDERIEVDSTVEELMPIANPANKNEKFKVLQVWGFIYRGQYRVRLTYYPMDGACVLMGQEIMEYASMSGAMSDNSGPDPMPPASGVIRELTLGDRACYIAIEQDGEVIEAMAFMELCERDDLIGQFATFEHEAAKVSALSCQGDPECTESETVLLISDVAL
jgi:hypothetical protein